MKFCPECGQRLTGSNLKGEKSYWETLMEESRRKSPWEGQNDKLIMPWDLLPRLVDKATVVCRERTDEVHTALVLIYEDGTRKVKCRGDCSDCPYGDVE